MGSQQENLRLERIEDKLDKLANAVVSIARAEEKLLALEKEHSLFLQQLMQISVRVEKTEKILIEQKGSVSFASKIFWLLVSSLIATGVGLYFTAK